jgi:hypothetical protein
VTKTRSERPVNADKPRVREDSRGHAVWQWAADTARNLAISTSQVLRRLDHGSLSLKEETSKQARLRKASPGGGFDPYDGRALGRAARAAPTRAPAKAVRGAGVLSGRSPGSAPSGSSWWRRLFRRA